MKSADSEIIKYSNWSLIKDLYFYVKPQRGRFILASLLRLTGDIVNLYPAIALASIVTFFSEYSAGSSLRDFWFFFALWALASFWRNIAVHGAKYLAFQVSEKSSLNAQLRAIKRLFSLDMAWHEKENAGNKLKKIQRGGMGIDHILRMWINNCIEIAVNFIGIIVILSRNDKFVSSAILFFLVSYFTISFFSLRKVSAIVQEVNAREEEMSGLVFQAINNVRSVKVAGIGGKLYEMIAGQAEEVFAWTKKRILNFQVRGTALNVWAATFRLGTLAFIAYGIYQGRSELGFFILFNSYFQRILESVGELSDVTQDLIVNKHSIARLQSIINEPVRIENEEGKADFPQNWKKISIKNLSFAYGKNPVLKNISLEIKRGERIGIVGLSGAGKSTLFKLLLKENESFAGDITVDGLSLKKIKKDSYLDRVGVVLQETEVFNFTLRENITIACNRDLDENELSRTLDIAHVSDFVSKLPLGINTFIGEKGVKLSGGEKQRLGIARCIYKQPDLLFLDEATSHLDLESEEKIKDSLHSFFKKVTAIVIAHRLTTIQEMDRILVIEKGELIESGSFLELCDRRGRFYELWEKQKL
ncbi:MAG: ABC transporter ATP-binding protein [Candidatus Falkowbacteria bacterium]